MDEHINVGDELQVVAKVPVGGGVARPALVLQRTGTCVTLFRNTRLVALCDAGIFRKGCEVLVWFPMNGSFDEATFSVPGYSERFSSLPFGASFRVYSP